MTKPKKPLRSLFASTEAPVQTPSRPATPVPMPRKDQPQRPAQTPQKPKTPPERLAPPPRIKPSVPMMIMNEAETEERIEVSTPGEAIEHSESKAESAAEMEMVTAPEVVVELERVVQPEVVVQLEPMSAQVEISNTLSAATMTMPEVISAPTTPPTNEERIMNVHYNFELMRPARESWQETDYAQFLKKLDALQTEAFILRGKLLSEAKNRFFETNKTGWAEFCESTLDMNYTTANQYIRVATEFDVTSHQRTDFGFEHFKALLPLPVEARSEFLNSDQPMSVKLIRTRVKELLMTSPSPNASPDNRAPLRQSAKLIRMLETLKSEVITHGASFETLTQPQKWQIAAACQNIAAHLNHLAQTLNGDPVLTPGIRPMAQRAGAFATADGVATMQEIGTINASSDNSN